jgi:LPXTG-motif cell wall-anchored protein
LLVGLAGSAFAGVVAPEIDASSAAAAVTLISGGLLVLRSRRKK